jgi:hypothetical protein
LNESFIQSNLTRIDNLQTPNQLFNGYAYITAML